MRDGRIEGEVRDLKEDIPIGNVEVLLDDGITRQRTDTLGAFAFVGIPDGRHLITAGAGAYLPHTDTLMLPVSGGLKGTLSLRLHKDVRKRCELYHP